LKNCNYHGHMHFDDFRAGGMLDVIEVIICAEEHMKGMIQQN